MSILYQTKKLNAKLQVTDTTKWSGHWEDGEWGGP